MSSNDFSHLARDIVAYREENSRLNEERQSHEQAFAYLEQRIGELEADIELQYTHDRHELKDLALYQALFNEAPLPLILINPHGECIQLNPAAADFLAVQQETAIGNNFRKYLSKESRIEFIKLLQRIQPSNLTLQFDKVLTLTNERGFTLSARMLTALNQKAPPLLLSLLEVSLKQLSSQSMRLSSTIIEQIREGLFITDNHGNIIKVNHAFTEITGYAEHEVLNKNPSILQSGRHTPDFYNTMWSEIQHHGWWAGEVWNKRKTGEVFPEWLQISRIKDEITNHVFYAATFSDITDRKYHQNQLDRLAFYDSLTGLPNRTLLHQTLDVRLSRVKTQQPYQLAVMFLDLDKFKDVNDHFGHAEGDKVLREATQRIVSRIRENDMVARIGGDEFVLVLTRIQAKQDAEQVAQELLSLLTKPFKTEKGSHFLSGSIGIAFSPKDGECVEDLMRRADAAMYVAKAKGRNTYHVFEPQQENQLIESNAMLTLLRLVIDKPDAYIQMHYQPIYRTTQTDQPVYYEALIRLIDQQGNLVYPGLFIEIAEQHGLIGNLGLALFERVCIDTTAGGLSNDVKIAVNLSPLQFFTDQLVDKLAAIAQSNGLNLSQFYFEITETATMQNLPLMLDILASLKRHGAKIMLDDFGTGYASLSMLKNIPVDVLKIDQGFIKEIIDSHQTQSLVKAMIAMAKALDLTTVAEGVETQQQADWLASHGVDFLQGYLLGRPKVVFLTQG